MVYEKRGKGKEMFIAKMIDNEEIKDDGVLWKKRANSLDAAKTLIKKEIKTLLKDLEDDDDPRDPGKIEWRNWDDGKDYSMTFREMFAAGKWHTDTEDEDGMILHTFWTGFDYSEEGYSFIIEEWT